MNKFFLIAFCVGTVVLGACDDPEEKPQPQPEEKSYDVMGLKEIPVGLWVTPPDGYQNTAEFARIRESGINFVNGFHYFENSNLKIMQTLDFCQENNLKYFANKAVVADDIHKYANKPDETLLKKFTDGIKPYMNHPAFAGELLIDEPGKPLFSALAKFTQAFEKAYPDKLWHVNLFPMYATGGIQAPSYADYINNWMVEMNPKFVSYDSYPLLTDGKIINDYYHNLDLIRSKTRFKKIPFWVFIQTLSIRGTPGVSNKREPSEADIRWQVWASLAFGAKGIQYFTYWTPGGGTEQFGDALITVDGKKTIRYDYVKKLNADFKEIGKILLECHAEGVIQTAASPYQLHSPLHSFGPVQEVAGDDAITGCFTSADGKKKFLIHPLMPEKGARVKLQLQNTTQVKVWRNAQASTVQVTNQQLELTMEKGEAVFIEF